VKTALEKTPPELSADVMNRGIVISGGGALLRNISHVLSEETEIPVFTAENPLESVAIGTGRSLEYIQHFRNHTNVATRATLEYVGGRMSVFRKKSLFIILIGIIVAVVLIGYSLSARENASRPEKVVVDTVGWAQTV